MPAGNTYPFDSGSVLTGRSTVPNTGSLPNGGSGISRPNAAGSGFDYAGAAATAVPAVMALFGGGDNEAAGKAGDANQQLQTMAQSLFGQGQKLQGQGGDAMAPVISYLMKVAGGDSTALLNATAPERGRVLDQYDTAKKALLFTPRGGGQASATAHIEASKASALTSQTAEARRSGINALASLSSDLMRTGAAESAAGTADLSRAIAGFNDQARRQDEEDSASGSAWGTIISIGLMAAMAASHSSLKDVVTPTAIDPQLALAGIRRLELRKWRYKGDATTHIGPMAEDFREIFGVGDGVTLHPADVFGVVLAVAKALAAEGKPSTP